MVSSSKMMSLFTHPRVISKLYDFILWTWPEGILGRMTRVFMEACFRH